MTEVPLAAPGQMPQMDSPGPAPVPYAGGRDQYPPELPVYGAAPLEMAPADGYVLHGVTGLNTTQDPSAYTLDGNPGRRDSHMRPEPDLVVFLKRLFYLERQEELFGAELRELNWLRNRLQDDWPAVSLEIATAYATMSGWTPTSPSPKPPPSSTPP